MTVRRTQRGLAAMFAAVAVAGLVVTGGQVASAAPGGGSGGQKTSTLYDAVPVPLDGNMPSLGFEATQTREFGDAVTFATGSNRSLQSVTVTLSSWGCEFGAHQTDDCVTTPGATFTHPITFNVYGADGATLIASKTQTFAIPFRPSASPKCTGTNAGKWYVSNEKRCTDGYAVNVTFTFPNVAVPASVVYGIAYNTTTAGYNPIGAAPCNTSGNPSGCGYDALNVGLTDEVIIGSTNEDEVWWNSALYGHPVFGPDTGWTDFVPAVQFKGANK